MNAAKEATTHNKTNEDYGFKTRQCTVLKFKEADLDDIVRLYAIKKPKDKEMMKLVWAHQLKAESGNYNNFTFIVRDRCKKSIGLIRLETKDKKNFRIEIWIPSESRKKRYFDHVLESVIEWAKDYTFISEIEMLIDVKDPYSTDNVVLMEHYKVA